MKELTWIEWAVLPLKKYADFSGRAPRAEYWWYCLGIGLLSLLLDYVDTLFGGEVVGVYGPVSLIFTLAVIVPGLAVTVRRLHDIDRSGWWALLNAGAYVFMAIGFVSPDSGQVFDDPSLAGLGLGLGVLATLVIAWLGMMIILLVFTVTRGTEGPNRFGDDPYGRGNLEEVFA